MPADSSTSSYSPFIPYVSSSPVNSQVAATLESKISLLIANNSVSFYAVSVVHEDQTVFTSGLATSPFLIGSVTKTFTAGWVAPAGNMYSTATDLVKYLIFLLKAKPALISAATIQEWTHPATIFPDGNAGFALPWELLKINSTGREFLIAKGGAIAKGNGGISLSVIAIYPSTQLGVSVLFAANDSLLLSSRNAIMEEVLDYLILLVEKETTGIIAPLYTGHYICKATPPIHNQPLNVTTKVLGGFIDIANSPSLGLFASINVSVLFDGQPFEQIATVGMLLKNSTQISFWLGIGLDCFNIFVGISSNPSTTDPNYSRTDYLYEIEFDFANKTVLWPVVGVVCPK